MSIRLTLPWPPSLSRYYRRFGVKTLISAAGRAYRTEAVALLRAARVPRQMGELDVSVDLYPPDRRRLDCDNRTKCLLDCFTHAGVWDDDSQISRLVITRHAVCPPGRVEVCISPWEGPQS